MIHKLYYTIKRLEGFEFNSCVKQLLIRQYLYHDQTHVTRVLFTFESEG